MVDKERLCPDCGKVLWLYHVNDAGGVRKFWWCSGCVQMKKVEQTKAN
jgi:ssDNA-binding Zn-finger/Zn-ribbon topoisomerase 1